MEEFKTYLEDDASEEERQAAELVEEGLLAIRLKEKVQQAAAERKKWQKVKYGVLTGLLLLSGAWYIYEIVKAEINVEAPAIEYSPLPSEETLAPLDTPQMEMPPEEPILPQETPKKEAPPKPPLPPPDLPIAQATPDPVLPPPAYGAPDTYLRGQSSAERDKSLLNELWYTSYPLINLTPGEQLAAVDNFLTERNFPLAYVGLQRLSRQAESTPSDTLMYLQAYTLLEMGQGQEATQLFNQLGQSPQEWQDQINWYRGLAHLLADQQAEALVIFQAIVQQPAHPYYLQAKKAIELYSE